jgi:hypothetical protein
LIKNDFEDTSKGQLLSEDLKSQIELFLLSVIERIKNNPTSYSSKLWHLIRTYVGAMTDQSRFLEQRKAFIAYITKEENATVSESRTDSGTVERTDLEKECVGIRIDQLLNTSREMTFEEGLGTEFYSELESIIKLYGRDSILALYYRIIMSKQFDPEVATETLNRLGAIDCPDAETYDLLRWLLEESLKHPSPWVREGAIMGLSRLNDPKTIPSLKSAAEKEQRHLLKRDE